jgi:hypothetical protein
MTYLENRIQDYISPIVEHLTSWYNDNNDNKDCIDFEDKWEKEQFKLLETCSERMTSQQQSELLYFYSIDEIIKQSTSRYGRPFYLIDSDIIKNNPAFVSFHHIGFTTSLIEQLLWTELQVHVHFIIHSNEIKKMNLEK